MKVIYREIIVAVVLFAAGCEEVTEPYDLASKFKLPPLPGGQYYFGVKIEYTDPDRGWIVANGLLYETENGGESWIESESCPESPGDIAFADVYHGWISAESRIYYTDDGGDSWSIQWADTNLTGGTLEVLDHMRVWLTGRNSTIFRTQNGGNAWESIHTAIPYKIWQLTFVDDTYGWAINVISLYATDDGGSAWRQLNEDIRGPMSIELINRSVGYMGNSTLVSSLAGDWAGIYRTEDSGSTWNENKLSDALHIGKIEFVSPDIGVAMNWCSLHYTIDGGGTWFPIENLPDGRVFSDISVVNESLAYTIDTGGEIFRVDLSP